MDPHVIINHQIGAASLAEKVAEGRGNVSSSEFKVSWLLFGGRLTWASGRRRHVWR